MKVGLVFGGRSVEHAISIRSASNILKALFELDVDVKPFYIDEEGFWSEITVQRGQPLQEALLEKKPVSLNLSTFEPFDSIDLFFPIVHGTSGEDGSLQGFFELLNKPYVGPRVQSSAICIDKEIAKRLIKAKGHLVSDYIVIDRLDESTVEEVNAKIGFPCFVKPASLGSSVGISKVETKEDLKKGIELAFEVDRKVLIEKKINGKEIEVGVIGSKKPQASCPVWVKTTHDFYSFEAKYLDPDGAHLEVPFQADAILIEKIQQEAIAIYKELGCESMARVDFFLTSDEELYLNEVNTLPGFTNISAFPKAFEALGVGFKDLIEILIDEAMIRFQSESSIQRSQLVGSNCK
jgi:D-alanine-D-alanine ligase